MNLTKHLSEPNLTTVDVDSVQRIAIHREIISRKPMVRDVFIEIHRLMLKLESLHLSASGMRVEIGAGVWPLRETDPDVLATDIVPAPHLDRILDAQQIDLPDASVRTIFGQHCFHHIPDPERFLNELIRVCPSGGGAVLVEPYWSPVAGFVFNRLFASEHFDKSAAWETPTSGAMGGANQALSYIVFERDKEIFNAKFPELEIVYQGPLGNYVRYLVSGGLNFRQLLPDFMSPSLKVAEALLRPANRVLALHHVLVIRRR